jgi:undecaprenyl-diphosphatase
VVLALLVVADATAGLDIYARDSASALVAGPTFLVAVLASEVGTAPYMVGIAVLAGLLAARLGARRDAALPVLILVVEWLSNPLLKALFQRQRPTDELWPPGIFGADQYSFPSGHAMASMALFSLLACWVWAWWPGRGRLAATVLVALVPVIIGLSRVALGVHWFSDVAGGWAAGLVVMGVTVLAWGRAGRSKAS